MLDSEYNMDIYKSLQASIGAVMRTPEMLKFVPNHLKTKEYVKTPLKNYLWWYYLWKLPFLIDIRINKCVIKQL